MDTTTPVTHASGSVAPLVSLLGEQRAAIVELLHRAGPCTVAEVAAHLGVSDVAARRHLAVLTDEGLVDASERRQPRGRPAACFDLTDRAVRLFPQAYDRFANEVLDFLSDTQGADGLSAFLRWRADREARALREAVTAEDLHGRLHQLAASLSDAGFEASVAPDREGFALVQEHCAIADVAREHPEVCASEAAAFSRVLGRSVRVARDATIAEGATACVCRITTR
jgi:predicted ArsR family transcriptional regulator